MISGRGLDITGGMLDKLESIPGFNVNLDRTRAIKQLERIGVFIGKSDPITPAKLLRWTRKRSDRQNYCDGRGKDRTRLILAWRRPATSRRQN